MFLKSVNDTEKRLKLVKHVSYEPYENITEVVPNHKMMKYGKGKLYEFDVPLNIFQKIN